MPSTQEAFGLAFLEAMACWNACIGAKIDSVKELIEENETGFLINAMDKEDLENKLFLLLSKKELREKMAEKARKKAENYSLQGLSQKYCDFFQEAIK